MQCMPPCGYHHVFPKESPAPNQSQSATSTSLSLPNPSSTSSTQLLCPTCNKPANGNCAHKMCKTHCITNKGGCHLTDHKPHRLSKRQKGKGVAPPLALPPSSRPVGFIQNELTAASSDHIDDDLDAQEEEDLHRALALSLSQEHLPNIDPALSQLEPDIIQVRFLIHYYCRF